MNSIKELISKQIASRDLNITTDLNVLLRYGVITEAELLLFNLAIANQKDPLKLVPGFPVVVDLNCERDCVFSRECANHTTAGDYRTEGGLTPHIECTSDLAQKMCYGCNDNSNGALVQKSGRLMLYSEYLDSMDFKF